MVHTMPEQVLGPPYLPCAVREIALTPKTQPGHLNDPKEGGFLKEEEQWVQGSQR